MKHRWQMARQGRAAGPVSLEKFESADAIDDTMEREWTTMTMDDFRREDRAASQ